MSLAGSVSPDPEPHHLDGRRPQWFSAAPDREGLPHYLTILRSSMWLIIAAVAVCVGAAFLYLAQAERVYEADADLLITPVPRDNTTLIGLGLPRESADPTRDIETMARLIETTAVARRAVIKARVDMGARELLSKVEASPVAQSNVVNIRATANDPEVAARIANAFSNASVDYRTERLHDQLDVAIPRLRRQISAVPATEEASRQALLERLRDLEALRALKDPTLRLETPAEAQDSPVSPRPVLSIAAAVLAGLLIGGAVALGSQVLDPRLRREEQLRRYRVPILARVPLERRSRARRGGAAPMMPDTVSPSVHDAYLLLGATLSVEEAGQHGGRRSVLVTGPSSGDGKTTSALNLATAISNMERVVLVETDSRRPTLARALSLAPKHGATNVLARRIPLGESLVPAGPQWPRLQMLVQTPAEAGLSAVMTPASADWLIRQSHLIANWLVVDAPPLTMVPDALSLAKQVDDVLLVVRVGNTRLKALEELAELLVQQGITPVGFVVVGGKSQASYYGA